MAKVAKISVALAAREVEWARARAEREGSSLSAVVTDAVRRARRAQAWNEVRDAVLAGKALSDAELDAAEIEWRG